MEASLYVEQNYGSIVSSLFSLLSVTQINLHLEGEREFRGDLE